MGRYFDRAWLIYNRAETGVYADLAVHAEAGRLHVLARNVDRPRELGEVPTESRGTRAPFVSRARSASCTSPAIRRRPTGPR